METLIKRSFFVLAATLTVTALRAQTADDIVNKYVSAIGGRDALNNTKSLLVESTTTVMGTDGDTKVTIVYGKGYKSEMEFNGAKMVQCVTPAGGWMIMPFGGSGAPTAMPDDQYKGQKINLILDPLANYATNGFKIELVDKDSVDYHIKASSSNGPDMNYYVNMKTYLLDRVSSHVSAGGQEGDVNITFSDYRKLDNGLMFPYSESLEVPQATLAIVVKKITVNPSVDPTTFDMPKQ